MLKLIQMLTSKQTKKTSTEVYYLPLGRRVVYLVDLEVAATLYSI